VGQRSGVTDDRLDPTAAAFDRLYGHCYPRVRAYVTRRVSRDRVDDVVADTFLVAWRKFDVVPSGDAALLWLYRVAHRTIGQHRRTLFRRRRLGDRIAALPTREQDDPSDVAVVDDDIRCVLAAAEHLNFRDAEVLRLASWEGLTNSEIATVLELSPNAVGQRLHRARRNLKKQYERLTSNDLAASATRDGGAS
jgi:RNA polymerase sigma factor (sigma-70 family)